MKKLTLFISACVVAINASAYNFMVDGIAYNKNADGTSVTVTFQNSSSPRYSTLSGNVTIPSSVTNNGTTYSVTSIGNQAFSGCSGLTSVTIGNSVTKIDKNAFSGCSGLTSVTIGNSVTTIGESAFSSCSGLTSVTIGNSVTTIGESAFSGCSSLNTLEIPNSVTTIGESAFSSCSGLTRVTIGNSVTSLGKTVFQQCENLSIVTLPKSLQSIGSGAFRNCYGLREVYAYWDNPPTISQLVFANTTMNTATGYYDSSIGSAIHIPSGTTSNYKAKIGWKNFYAIEDLDIIVSPSCFVLNNEMALLQLGETLQLTVLTDNVGEITWTSDNEDIATVDSNGLVTAVSPGIVCIRATDANGISSFCAITSYLHGDYNEDGKVNISDVQKLFDIVMGIVRN